jgi:hypothetical protein
VQFTGRNILSAFDRVFVLGAMCIVGDTSSNQSERYDRHCLNLGNREIEWGVRKTGSSNDKATTEQVRTTARATKDIALQRRTREKAKED